MIQATDIYKSYGTLGVLKGITLEVKPAEIVAIVGASGAGKSTLLHILGTLDQPDRGSLRIAGETVSSLKEKQLSRFRNQRIGFVFQAHHLLPEFTALENCCIPALIARTRQEDSIRRAKELLEYLGLHDRMEHKPAQLSGGEQQRVAVARALMNKPAVVFADEPSGNLDSHHAGELHRLFFDLRKEFGQTFVIVTHNEALANMADRKLLIKDGVISQGD